MNTILNLCVLITVLIAHSSGCDLVCHCCMCGCGDEGNICLKIPNGGPNEPYCCASEGIQSCTTPAGHNLTIYNSKCTAVAFCGSTAGDGSCTEVLWPLIFLSLAPLTVLLLVVLRRFLQNNDVEVQPTEVQPAEEQPTEKTVEKLHPPAIKKEELTHSPGDCESANSSGTDQLELLTETINTTRENAHMELMELQKLQKEHQAAFDTKKAINSQHEQLISRLGVKDTEMHAAEDDVNIHNVRLTHLKEQQIKSQQSLTTLQESLSDKLSEQSSIEGQVSALVSLRSELDEYITPVLKEVEAEATKLLKRQGDQKAVVEKLQQQLAINESGERISHQRVTEMMRDAITARMLHFEEVTQQLLRLHEKEKTMRALESQIEATKMFISKRQSSINKATETSTALTAERESLKKAYCTGLEPDTSDDKSTKYHSEHKLLTSDLRNIEDECRQLTNQLTQLTEEKHTLSIKVEAMMVEHSSLKKEFETTSINTESTRKQIVQKNKDIEVLEAHILNRQEEVKRLLEEVVQKKGHRSDVEAEKVTAEEQLCEQQQKLATSENVVSELREQIESLQRSIAGLCPESHTQMATERVSLLEIEISKIKEEISEGVLQQAFRSAELRDLEKKHNLTVEGIGAELRIESQRRIDIHKKLLDAK